MALFIHIYFLYCRSVTTVAVLLKISVTFRPIHLWRFSSSPIKSMRSPSSWFPCKCCYFLRFCPTGWFDLSACKCSDDFPYLGISQVFSYRFNFYSKRGAIPLSPLHFLVLHINDLNTLTLCESVVILLLYSELQHRHKSSPPSFHCHMCCMNYIIFNRLYAALTHISLRMCMCVVHYHSPQCIKLWLL